LRTIIYHILSKLTPEGVPEILPRETRERHHLMPRYDALVNVHFPSDDGKIEEYNEARSSRA